MATLSPARATIAALAALNIAAPADATTFSPAFIVPAAGTIKSAQFRVDGGSGTTWQLYKNGAAAAGMTTSPAASSAVQTHDFAEFPVSAGDYLQLRIVTASTGTNLSVMVFGAYQ